jgi:S1-C subfamily serine protease
MLLDRVRCSRVIAVVGAVVVLGPGSVWAFQNERVAKPDAALIVDGIVREIFRSSREGRVDYLVQIEVTRAEIGRPISGGARPAYPAPSESVYVHVFQGPGGYGSIPSERSQVRAYLAPRSKGGWEGTFPDWFEVTVNQAAGPSANDPAPPMAENGPAPRGTPAPEVDPTSRGTPAPAGSKTALASLGVTVETLSAQGHRVLRVTSVERGGAGQKAGLEVGDIIAGVNNKAITDADQVEQAARRGGTLALVVVDVNNGNGVRVDVALGSAKAGGPSIPVDPNSRPEPSDAPKPSIGLSAEPVTLGQRTAMKVVRVEPGSPAQKAGFEIGDVIVAANGAPITGAEQLAAAFRKSGSTLTLTVRDTRTGKEVPVKLQLAGRSANPSSFPFPLPSPGTNNPASSPTADGSRNRLGAVTELTIYDVEAAVKVTEVESGSPAERAGIRPGLVILAANGKTVLHPNDLAEAVRQSSGAVELTVVDPSSGRKGTVKVDLGA